MLSVQMCVVLFFFFKQKTAYEMRISDGSSDVCSSDLDRKLPVTIKPRDLLRRKIGGRWRNQPRDEDQADQRDENKSGPAPGVQHLVPALDRKSVVSGKSVSVRVDLGGRRIIKKQQ